MTRLKLNEIPAVIFPAEGNLQMARVNLPCNFGCEENKKSRKKIAELYLDESSCDVSFCINDSKFQAVLQPNGSRERPHL